MSGSGDDTGGEGFLGRWSTRKRRSERRASSRSRDAAIADPDDANSVRDTTPEMADSSIQQGHGIADTSIADELDQQTLAEEVDKSVATEAATGDQGDDAEPLLTDADMPPLDTLSSDSDMSPFFNPGVTAALRRAALRHVFSLPSYNLRDGLNDYDDDYTVFEPLGDTVTSDMKFHAARHERNRLEREAQEAAEREQQLAASADEPDGEESGPEEEVAEESDSDHDHVEIADESVDDDVDTGEVHGDAVEPEQGDAFAKADHGLESSIALDGMMREDTARS